MASAPLIFSRLTNLVYSLAGAGALQFAAPHDQSVSQPVMMPGVLFS
jgi:hypothetical protein